MRAVELALVSSLIKPVDAEVGATQAYPQGASSEADTWWRNGAEGSRNS